MSVMVPTVERTLPPSLRWSITTTGESPSTESTSGRPYEGSRLRTNAVNVSFSSRWASAAIVSKTRDVLPEPETPVNAVIARRGSVTLMSRRLCWRAPTTRISPPSAATGAPG
jgi:hypothetical protein